MNDPTDSNVPAEQPVAMPGSRADVYSKIAAGAAAAPESMEALVRSMGEHARTGQFVPPPAHVETMPMQPGNPLLQGGGTPSGVPMSFDEEAAAQVAAGEPPAPGLPGLPNLADRFRDPGATPPVVPTEQTESADPTEDPEIAPDPRVNPKAAHAFNKLRQDSRRAAEQAKALSQELLAAKQAAELAQKEREQALQDLERIRGSHETLASQLAKLNLAESPEFKQKYETPINEAVMEVVRILRTNSVEGATGDPRKAEELARELLAASPREIVAATKELPDALQTLLLQKSTDMAKLTAERERALDDWKAERVNVEATMAHTVKQNEQIQRRELAEKAIDYARKVSPIYGGLTESEQATSGEVAAQFLAFAQFASQDELMKCAAEGFASPLLYPQVSELARENAYLKNMLADRGRLGFPPIGVAPAGFPYGGAVQPAPAPREPAGPANVQRVNGGGGTTADYLEQIVAPEMRATAATFRRTGMNR